MLANSNSILTIDIQPDTETIETFNHNSILPNETYTITGTLQVHLTRPMQIRQIYIRFQGVVTSILSSIDFLRDKSEMPPYGDEIPLEKWETNVENISLMDKVARKAFGYSNISYTVVKEVAYVLDELQELPAGVSSWPFSITINKLHLLPPSILLPFHQIQYCLSAHIKSKNGLSDRLKVSYWNSRRKTSNSSDDQEEMEIDNPPSFISTKVRQYLLGADYIIQIKQYNYPGINSLDLIPRIRFRGSRKDFLSYEVSMPKFTCLQKKSFPFICTFRSLSPEATIDKIESCLIQTETYP